MIEFNLDDIELELDGDALQKADFTEALTKLGMDAVEDAQRYAPVRTGGLRDSINFDVQDNELTLEAGVEYGAFVEMGTSRQPAQPYLRPGLESAINRNGGGK